jgi:DNA-binding GntR family transcriptional regulator
MDALTAPVQQRSLVDELVERLQRAIASGELAPGARVREAPLAAKLGVSRGPLREAICRLEGRKLVVRTPNLGTRVAAISARDLEELLVLREALEGMACRLAAAAMTDAELADLNTALGRQAGSDPGKALPDYFHQDAADFDIHRRIVRGARNRRLAELLYDDIHHLVRIYRYRGAAAPGRYAEAYAEHQAIVAALAARDAEAAEAAMRRHLARARAVILEQLQGERADDAG